MRASIYPASSSLISPLDQLAGGNQFKGLTVDVPDELAGQELRPRCTNLAADSCFSPCNPKVSIFYDHQAGSIFADASMARHFLDQNLVFAITVVALTFRRCAHSVRSPIAAKSWRA